MLLSMANFHSLPLRYMLSLDYIAMDAEALGD